MKLRAPILLALLAIVGCGPDESYEVFEEHHHDLAVAGPWQIPANIVTQANGYAIGYTGAGPWRGTSGCSGNFTAGAQALRDWVLANWPQVTQVGGYSCRPIVGNSSSMSVHGTGRAIDIHIPLDGGQADNGLGDPLANYLVEHADELGIQMVIWDRWLWSPSRSPRSRAYTGQHAHHDHLHVEITPQAAAKQLPWYQGGASAPQAAPCDPVPSSGRVIDDADSCFVAFGPSQYWRRASAGNGGSLLWTNAWTSANPSNWARWNLDITQSGLYTVEYYRTGAYAQFNSTRYRVRAGGVESDVYLDQGAGGTGWEEIGTFSFSSGANQWISIYDNTPGAVSGDQRIVVDAIRLRPASSFPPPSDGGGTGGGNTGGGDPGNTGGGNTGGGNTGGGDPGNTGGGNTGGGNTGGGNTGGGNTGDNGSGGNTGDDDAHNCNSGGNECGTSDLPTGAVIDLGRDEDETAGAAPGDYGTESDAPLPPKGQQQQPQEDWHDVPEVIEPDAPPGVHMNGDVGCATATGNSPAPTLLPLLFGIGVAVARRRVTS